jgi:hypothetical protein
VSVWRQRHVGAPRCGWGLCALAHGRSLRRTRSALLRAPASWPHPQRCRPGPGPPRSRTGALPRRRCREGDPHGARSPSAATSPRRPVGEPQRGPVVGDHLGRQRGSHPRRVPPVMTCTLVPTERWGTSSTGRGTAACPGPTMPASPSSVTWAVVRTAPAGSGDGQRPGRLGPAVVGDQRPRPPLGAEVVVVEDGAGREVAGGHQHRDRRAVGRRGQARRDADRHEHGEGDEHERSGAWGEPPPPLAERVEPGRQHEGSAAHLRADRGHGRPEPRGAGVTGTR